MTITHDPQHPLFLDEADVRNEMTRVFNQCHQCQLCLSLCPTFPSLFTLVDQIQDHDAGRLTPQQQDMVASECFQCALCVSSCPYSPERDVLAIDVPRLMIRHHAMRRAHGQESLRARISTSIKGHVDLVGRLATLLRVCRHRFSSWFLSRSSSSELKKGARVGIFPTCVVEYQLPGIGQDLVHVYERNDIECSLVEGARCCGAPFLHGGDVETFTKVATRQVKALATEIRAGKSIVIPQPVCSYVVKKEFPIYVPGPDADLVARYSFDASEYLMTSADVSFNTDFSDDVPETVAYRVPRHLVAQGIGHVSADMMRLAGITVTTCDEVEAQIAPDQTVVGDTSVGHSARNSRLGETPLHPLQVIARAYGRATDG